MKYIINIYKQGEIINSLETNNINIAYDWVKENYDKVMYKLRYTKNYKEESSEFGCSWDDGKNNLFINYNTNCGEYYFYKVIKFSDFKDKNNKLMEIDKPYYSNIDKNTYKLKCYGIDDDIFLERQNIDYKKRLTVEGKESIQNTIDALNLK